MQSGRAWNDLSCSCRIRAAFSIVSSGKQSSKSSYTISVLVNVSILSTYVHHDVNTVEIQRPYSCHYGGYLCRVELLLRVEGYLQRDCCHEGLIFQCLDRQEVGNSNARAQYDNEAQRIKVYYALEYAGLLHCYCTRSRCKSDMNCIRQALTLANVPRIFAGIDA